MEWDQQVDECSVCNKLVAASVCCGEKETKLKGKAFDLLVNQCSYPHLWLWALDIDQKIQQPNEFPSFRVAARLRAATLTQPSLAPHPVLQAAPSSWSSSAWRSFKEPAFSRSNPRDDVAFWPQNSNVFSRFKKQTKLTIFCCWSRLEQGGAVAGPSSNTNAHGSHDCGVQVHRRTNLLTCGPQ